VHVLKAIIICRVKILNGHRCATNFVDYLREFEAIFENAVTCKSGTQSKLFDKKTEVENLVAGSLSNNKSIFGA
jgi:hypothetical protein